MGLPVQPFQAPLAHPVREHPHLGQHLVHAGHHVLAVHQHGAARTVAQGRVQHGAVFGDVDLPARKHGLGPGLHAPGPGQVHEHGHGPLGDPVLGVVEKDVFQAQRELVEAVRVQGKQFAHVQGRDFLLVFLQGLPLGRAGQARHGPPLCSVRITELNTVS